MAYVLCPLTWRSSSSDPARAALMWDTVRWNIKLTKLTKSTRPGFYMYKGKLHEVCYESLPTPIPQGLGAPAQSYSSSHVSAPAWPGTGIRSFAANASGYPPHFSPTPANLVHASSSRLVLRPMDGEINPGTYTLDLTFGRKFNQQIWWLSVPGNGPLRYKVMPDTGGAELTWIYSTYREPYGIHDRDTRVALTSNELSKLADKAKCPYNAQGAPPVGRVVYGNGITVDMHTVTPDVTGIFKLDGTVLSISEFRPGAAIGFSPGILDVPFDGIVGLGRRSGRPEDPRSAVSLLQQMINRNVIQYPCFYICCRSQTELGLGDGFLSFGGWPDEFRPEPIWTTVNVHPNARRGSWDVHLSKINILVPGKMPVPVRPDCMVTVDNGTNYSFLPEHAREELKTILDDAATDMGFTRFTVHHSVEVEFIFVNVTVSGIDRKREETTVSIRGSAREFFQVPVSDPSSDLAYALSDRPSEIDDRFILGINFFHTFIVGFRDSPHNPAVLLAPQPA